MRILAGTFVVAGLALALGVSGCSAGLAESSQSSLEQAASLQPTQALSELQSEDGPPRFGMVTPGLYRGGPPDERDLVLLRALGVTKIVDLRREALYARRAERDRVRALGMAYVEYPFYGVFGADPSFLDALVAQLLDAGGGSVYVHCDNGRDRTGLAAALYRVVAQGWNPDRAWADEVEAYGERRSPVFRELELTYRDYTHLHGLRMAATRDGAARRRAITATVGNDGATSGEVTDARPDDSRNMADR